MSETYEQISKRHAKEMSEAYGEWLEATVSLAMEEGWTIPEQGSSRDWQERTLLQTLWSHPIEKLRLPSVAAKMLAGKKVA
jgi:hypothetical protein